MNSLWLTDGAPSTPVPAVVVPPLPMVPMVDAKATVARNDGMRVWVVPNKTGARVFDASGARPPGGILMRLVPEEGETIPEIPASVRR